MGCDTDVLDLLGVNPSRKELEEKILSSDLIYVSGGNTLKLMRRCRRLGVDKILKTAHDMGIVLAGLSAGAICWFKKIATSATLTSADNGREVLVILFISFVPSPF